MKKVAFLLSHIPNPRMLKRIKTIQNDFYISIIYWDRGQRVKETFEVSPNHNVEKILLKAPLGQPIKRIIPWMRFFIKSFRMLKKEDPSIIHVSNLDMLLIANFYKRTQKKATKVIYEVADLPKHWTVNKVRSIRDIIMLTLKKIEVKLMDRVSKLILTSPYFWEVYYSKFTDKEKYMFLPNAPYWSVFKDYNKKTYGTFTIGFIGSVRFIEQLKMLIEAVEEIGENIDVFIAGGGPCYHEIKKITQDKKFVKLHGPYNYEKEIVKLYENVDCVYSVYNTKTEGVKVALPNRLYEAIVCSLPIIASKNTALGDFIEKNEIGFVVSNKSELKASLIELKNNKNIIKKIEDNCNNIKYNYYFEKSSEYLLKEYLNL
nr:glycosyltransferase [Sedimentibacter sp.]